VVGGFGGMRDDGGRLRFDPRLPAGWEALEFKLRWRGARIRARVTRDAISLAVETPGARTYEALTQVEVRGEPYSLSAAEPLAVPLNDRSAAPG
jgi:alpha,alpha-trehalose phosphorylase